MGDMTRNFNHEEFRCPHCGQNDIVPHFVFMLQRLRDMINGERSMRNLAEVPIIVTSGYRCEEHNRRVGGKPDSKHLYGIAADICIPRMTSLELFGIAVQSDVFTGIGLYPEKRIVHVDIRSDGPSRWAYLDGVEMGVDDALDELVDEVLYIGGR